MKKILAIISLALVAVVGLAGCSNSSSNQSKIGQVTDSGGVHDKSFNQGTNEGIKKYTKEKNLPDPAILESKSPADIEANLRQASSKLEVVAASGFLFVEPLAKVAPSNTKVKYILIDGEVKADNIASVLFAEQEAGYLAGVAAAKSTKTKKIGFVGGKEIPPVQKFLFGFIQGVKDTDASIEITSQYANNFDKESDGQSIASAMYAKNIDIIFHAAGGVGKGVINEAKNQRRNDKNKKVWVIGVDRDQYEEGKLDDGSSVILTSATKYVDVAAYDMLKAIDEGKFPGGKTTTYTVKENGVGLPKENPNLSDSAKKAADEALGKIKSGEIVPPAEKSKITKTDGIVGQY